MQTLDSPAWGRCLATLTADDQVLDAWYPGDALGLGEPPARDTESADTARADARPDGLARTPAGKPLPETAPGPRTVTRWVTIGTLADPPKDALDVYLRLHLLSHRLIQPNHANLDGVFGLLANVAWTSAGPCAPDRVDELRWALRASGQRLVVYGVDKFPRMVDYVVPAGVRIADADRVRLGAHLAAGTTVMHEGFVNFNAGTLGTSMVEGRISQGVVVDDGSDIGGGASIMGTLSGGGKDVIRVGKRCLIGANAGLGISLGDDCVVAAGCYVTAGAKLLLPDGRTVKARELSGLDNLLFWQNSVTGAIEARERAGRGIELNAALHAN